jgi:hypothetical protein
MATKKREVPAAMIPRISDIVPVDVQVDELVHTEDILETDITVESISERTGEKGPYNFVSFRKDGDEKLYGVNLGGVVLVKKLTFCRTAAKFPFRMKIVQPEGKRYFDAV